MLYHKFALFDLICLVCLFLFCDCQAPVTIDCQKPPHLVDPAICCKDGGRDQYTEICAKRYGLTGQPTDPPPTIETATCLAECILTESHYLQQTEALNFETIRADLMNRFSNDTVYAQTMYESFEKCLSPTQNKMNAYRQMPLGNAAIQRSCSPFGGMLLGCTYMEYFKNCPKHRWTSSADCELAKQFVTQCGLGA